MTTLDARQGSIDALPPGLPGLLDELRWRGMHHDHTPGLPERLATGRLIAGYIGFDPSAPSLHVGSLVPIFGLLHLQRRGGRPVVVVGGGTGMIGDPSGRSSERNLLDRPTLDANVASLREQLGRFLDFSPGPSGAVMVNNLDWLAEMSMLDFLRDVGKHFTIPYMLAKDSVQVRLDRGLSFTEFSYMLLQAADFEHLYRTMGVEMQMGGADQWGNITAGLELIRRLHPASTGEAAFGLCYPLFMNPSGEKFGKTADGTSVWLDPARTSPFAFYQYWINTEDGDAAANLRTFTLLDRAEVDELMSQQAPRPESRVAQRALAFDVTARVHGTGEAEAARARSEAVFSGAVAKLDLVSRAFIAAELPHGSPIPRTRLTEGMPVDRFVTASGVLPSMSEALRLIGQGGLYIEDRRVLDRTERVDATADGLIFVRLGKRRYLVVEIVD